MRLFGSRQLTSLRYSYYRLIIIPTKHIRPRRLIRTLSQNIMQQSHETQAILKPILKFLKLQLNRFFDTDLPLDLAMSMVISISDIVAQARSFHYLHSILSVSDVVHLNPRDVFTIPDSISLGVKKSSRSLRECYHPGSLIKLLIQLRYNSKDQLLQRNKNCRPIVITPELNN